MEYLCLITTLLIGLFHYSASIECYKCLHLDDVHAHVPKLPDMGDILRDQLLSRSNDACRQSGRVPDLKPEKCEVLEGYQSSCSSMDLKVKTSFKLPMEDDEVAITLGFRARIRGCGYNNLESNANITCGDVNKYPENIQQAIGSFLQMGSDPQYSVQGNMCFCNQDNCNFKLPDAKMATTSPKPTSTSFKTKKPELRVKTTPETELPTRKKPGLKTTPETKGYKLEPSQPENNARTISFCYLTVTVLILTTFL